MAAGIAKARYLALTTFRRDGSPVRTPVWFAADGDRLLVWTDAPSGKVKRIRANPNVTIAPCNVGGRPKGAAVAGEAYVLDKDEGPRVQGLLGRKHRVMKPIVDAYYHAVERARRRPRAEEAYLEIRPVP